MTIGAYVRVGKIRKFEVTPETFVKMEAPLSAVRGGSAEENAALLRRILSGAAEANRAPRDIVVINAAAALLASGVASDLREGSERAEQAIASGAAAEKLAQLQRFGRE